MSVKSKSKKKTPSAPGRRGFFLRSTDSTSVALDDLIGLQGMTEARMVTFLDRAEYYRKEYLLKGRKSDALKGKTVMNLFFEPSTRTRTSFELAAKRLSADIINMSPQSSSLSKGESLKDMIMNLEAMGSDLMVVRHGASGAAGMVAHYSSSPVINAGDGSHEHPTQALIDLFTVRSRFKKIRGLKVVIVGDIAYSRVARSNIHGFTTMGARVTVVGPATLLPPGLETFGVVVDTSLDKHLKDADVVMLLRIQQERQEALNFPSLHEYTQFFGLTKDRIRLMKKEAVIMHPGPINRGIEIAPSVADGTLPDVAKTIILEQVENATAVRMGILSLLAGGTHD